jgi:fructosamine-3-kinase
MQAWNEIGRQITVATNFDFKVREARVIGGGCINQAYCVTDGKQRYFIKLNKSDCLAMFEAEAAGLMEIHQSHTLRVPLPICYGHNEHAAWLVLEYLDINNSGGNAAELGKQLAAMHRITSKTFGWVRNNTLGQTLQINTTSSDWINFWRTHRLSYQLDLAKNRGFTGRLQVQGEHLLIDLDKFFPAHCPAPSLLHGDLWQGNFAYDQMKKPVLFDPAVYYGDREADIAMTELFAGFPADFYSAYRHDYPLDSGYNIRKVVYNLYHVLNHLNIFGGSYRHQAEQMMNRLLAELH